MNKNLVLVFSIIVGITFVLGISYTPIQEFSVNSQDSNCFTTPSLNEFCYPNPTIYETQLLEL